jgi:predicted nucleic acid-binding protein
VARPEVPDTSALLDAVRRPDRWPALRRSLQSGHVWLSAVVVAELYAGTRSADDALFLDRIVAAMQRVGRMLIPTEADWARAGRLIARRIRLQGELRPRDHLADVLILVSAARLNGAVITANLRHFEAWGRLANAAGLDVVVRSTTEPNA